MASQPLSVLQGTLDLLVLRALTWDTMHGYAIMRWIRQTADGELEVEDAALYPSLHRLEVRGLIEAEWGLSENNRRARFYRITAAGPARAPRRAGELAPLREGGRPGHGARRMKPEPDLAPIRPLPPARCRAPTSMTRCASTSRSGPASWWRRASIARRRRGARVRNSATRHGPAPSARRFAPPKRPASAALARGPTSAATSGTRCARSLAVPRTRYSSRSRSPSDSAPPTAILSVVNGVLLRPLPYDDPSRLTWIYEWSPTRRRPQPRLQRQLSRLEGALPLVRRDGRPLPALSTSRSPAPASQPDVVALDATPSVLAVLGVRPRLGRLYTDSRCLRRWPGPRHQSRLLARALRRRHRDSLATPGARGATLDHRRRDARGLRLSRRERRDVAAP